MAGLLERPNAGEVIIGGRATGKLSDADRTMFRRLHIGFVYQFHHLLPEFTALENVMMPQLIRGIDPREARRRSHAASRVYAGEGTRHPPAGVNCPAASSSASPSPVRWPTPRACCWPTSRPAISTRDGGFCLRRPDPAGARLAPGGADRHPQPRSRLPNGPADHPGGGQGRRTAAADTAHHRAPPGRGERRWVGLWPAATAARLSCPTDRNEQLVTRRIRSLG